MQEQHITDRDFCGWLRRARIDQDLTQEALAESVHCSTQTIRSFESGRRRPSRELAIRLADVLQVPADERSTFIRLARTPLVVPETPATPATLPAAPLIHSIPTRPHVTLPSDALIGRHADLQRLHQALLVARRRLVTLLGPGGIGKTRLALQAATDLAAHFRDGVVFVALASISDPADMTTAIAEAIGCPLPGTQRPDVVLLAFLRERSLLLVLDNLEHLLGHEYGDHLSMFLTDLLREAPQVMILATSRERLRLRAESVVELDGLSLPTDDRPGVIERAEATMLFLERARQVADTFALTPENRSAVARICRLLGGVPLGIELAAAWVRMMSCEEIVNEMARSIDFLALDDRDLPLRHRSMRAVIDHSWQLLSPQEQLLLLRLSVFRGGFRREAAEAVCTDVNQLQATRSLLPALSALVDKSLLRRTEDHDRITRYDLHEVLRQYLAARLAADPQAEAIAQQRHADYYAEWLTVWDAVLKGPRQNTALRAITDELGNIRVTWRWAAQQQDTALLRQMTATLHWFYEVRGWNTEGVTLFGIGAAALRQLAEDAHATADTRAAYWLLVFLEGWHAVRSDPANAIPRLQAGLAGQRLAHDPWALALSLSGMGFVRIFSGDYAGAQALLEEGHALTVLHGYAWLDSMLLVVRGVLEALRSNAAIAQHYLAVALPVARAIGDPRHISLTLNYLGLVALNLGQIDEAERVCHECLAIAQEHQDRFQTSLVLQSLGRVAMSRGAYAEAKRLLNDGLIIAREIGDHWLEAQAHGCLGQLATATGDAPAARAQHRAAVSAAAAAPQAIALDELAALADLEFATQPDASMAALAYVRNHPLTRPAARTLAEQRWQEIRQQRSSERCAAAEVTAQSFPPDQPAALLTLFNSNPP